MTRFVTSALRPTGLAAALALVMMYLQPQVASAAAGISLMPTVGTPGTTVTISGSGFPANQAVTVDFNNVQVVTNPTPLVTNATGSFSGTFNVPSLPPGFYAVTAIAGGVGSAAPFQVTSSNNTTTLALQKAVSVNGGQYGTNVSASPGSTLSYLLSYANTGVVAAVNATITDVLQPGQTLQAVSPSCSPSTSGGVTTVTCNLGTLPPSPQIGSSGNVYIVTTVNTGFSGTIPNSATMYAANAAATTSNPSTVVSVGVPSNLVTLSKTVSVNGQGYTTSATANPGDQLVYSLTYTNNSGVTASSVVITDAIQAGQSLFTVSPSCTINAGTYTVTCAVGNVASGSSASVYIGAFVNATFAGTIRNMASATYNGATVQSNSTVVTVGTPVPTPSGTLTLCGLVNSYAPAGGTAGAITISGVIVTIAPGASVTGSIATGANVCVGFAFNSAGQANVLVVSSNAPGVGLACGVYTPSATPGFINVGGIPIQVGTGINLTPFLTQGFSYCFLLTPGGQIYGVLSGIPTSAHVVAGGLRYRGEIFE
ncbi:MAG TPA: hypothetical protein VKX16_08660 [Chloroflexota bacterium]|nr:hypothetical protein [Chloroflexota bacterium]